MYHTVYGQDWWSYVLCVQPPRTTSTDKWMLTCQNDQKLVVLSLLLLHSVNQFKTVQLELYSGLFLCFKWLPSQD